MPGTKCFLFAWVPAWGAGLYVASAMIAGMEFVEQAAACGLPCTFAVADAIPPQAKLVFGALLGAFMWLSRKHRPHGLAALMIRDAASGLVAALLVLELLPGGFGIYFLDVAYFPAPNMLYLAGAAIGGLLGTLLERSCRRQLVEA